MPVKNAKKVSLISKIIMELISVNLYFISKYNFKNVKNHNFTMRQNVLFLLYMFLSRAD